MSTYAKHTSTTLSLVLGLIMLPFGFLKFFEPIHGWFVTQVTASGLPAISVPAGIATELAIGASFLGSFFARRRVPERRRLLVLAVTSAGLVAQMAVAVFVHLQPEVPAAVLPLGIKPPILPLSVMALAIWEIMLVTSLARGGRFLPRP